VSKRYGALERERGLIAVALANGNTYQAARDLEADKENGFKVSQKTLWEWSRKDVARYEELQDKILPRLRRIAAEQHMEAAKQAADLTSKAMALAEGKLDEIPPRDLPGAIRNFSTSSAIHVDKAAELRGEAKVIVEHRSASEVLKELQAEGVELGPQDQRVLLEATE
jgi:lysine/ornithine N-monooxygenase